MDLESLFVLRRCCISAAPGDAIMPSVSHPASLLRPLQEQERSNSANVGFKITLGSPDALEAWSLGPGGRKVCPSSNTTKQNPRRANRTPVGFCLFNPQPREQEPRDPANAPTAQRFLVRSTAVVGPGWITLGSFLFKQPADERR
jgi:hypothetical protein